jgi:2-dehydro-3-deoxygalactonokinase
VAGALHAIDARTWIVPGLSDPRGDVMRGEEVQLLGAVAAGLAPPDALLCQPGTHCKWARMEGARSPASLPA